MKPLHSSKPAAERKPLPKKEEPKPAFIAKDLFPDDELTTMQKKLDAVSQLQEEEKRKQQEEERRKREEESKKKEMEKKVGRKGLTGKG